MKGITAYRQSILNDFGRYCPWKVYMQHSVDVVKDMRKPKAMLGSAIHTMLHLIGNDFREVMVDPRQIESLEKLWITAWDHTLLNPEDPREADLPIDWWPDEVTQLAQFKELAITMMRQYCLYCPDHEVLVSEKQFEFHLGKYPIQGRIDQIWKMEGENVLVDFKSGSILPHDDTIRESYQFAIYVIGAKVLGFDIDRFAWYHLQDHVPYAFAKDGKNRKTYIPREASQELGSNGYNRAKIDWVRANGEQMLNKETGELRDRYSFNSGQPRGPGLYDFPVTEEWLETREPLILAACGALAQANPVKIIGEHCQLCDLRLTCRDNIYNRISKKEEQQIANVMQEIEEEL